MRRRLASRWRHLLVCCGLLTLCAVQTISADDTYRHAREPIGTVEQIYDGKLMPDLAVRTFRNIDRLFPTRIVKASSHPREFVASPLVLGDVTTTIDGKRYDLNDFFALDSVTGLIVLKDGQLVYEAYQRGNGPDTRWMSMSITSTLIGAAIRDGIISSLDDPVVKYVPRLEGSAYDGVTIRQILTMSSGVRWNETYTDPASDRRRLLAAQIAQRPGGLIDVMAGLERAAEPGTVHNYSTGETQVAGEILIGATGGSLSAYLAEKIWKPWGMEADARWWLESPGGREIAGSGLAATLRDFARFGQFFLEGGVIDGKPVLPDGWTTIAGRPASLKDGTKLEYGLMWWPGWTAQSQAHGAFAAIGIQGQNIYINPTAQVVIAMTAAQTKPEGMEPIDPMAFFDAIVSALQPPPSREAPSLR